MTVSVLWPFLTVPWVGLMVFPDCTHLLSGKGVQMYNWEWGVDLLIFPRVSLIPP